MRPNVDDIPSSSPTIRLLGHPSIVHGDQELYRFRSQKSWGLLAYLILAERPPSRPRLATLLFSEANDPLRALRWSLAEIRRALGDSARLEGDPVELDLGRGTVVDIDVLTRGSWTDAVLLPGLGQDLLEGTIVRSAPAFEAWLVSQQHHFGAASEAILHEASLAASTRGAARDATDYAVRLVAMNPLDENHQALLIRSYQAAGDHDAALRQLAICTELFEKELGSPPGVAVRDAAHAPPTHAHMPTDATSIEALLEAGSAAVGAGAVEAGVRSLRAGVGLSDTGGFGGLRVRSRLALAEALIHSLRGRDEEGIAALHHAGEIALVSGESELAAAVSAELGYVDFLRARYDRAERWLLDALRLGGRLAPIAAKATTYLGSVESDRGNYRRAMDHLEDGLVAARTAGDRRVEAYASSMVGRIHLLRGDLDQAVVDLETSIELAESDRWLAFLPWPQALRGEVELARADPERASQHLQQAFARACQLGDPCWEGIAARGIALAAEMAGEPERALELLGDARVRCNRLSDPYVWLDGHILDAQCTLGLRHRHPETSRWIGQLHELASRAGMRELVVRSLVHRAAMGGVGDLEAAVLLRAEIDNPALDRLFPT